MKPTKWPFRPDHITKDKEKYPPPSELNKLTGEGIIPNEYLKGILFTIANNLECPIMIMEFSPKSDDKFKPDEDIIRTAAQSINFDFQPPCKKFREYNIKFLCDKIEKGFAYLFRNLTKANLTSELPKKKAKLVEYIGEYIKDPEVCFFLKESAGHPYLEFNCPILAYRTLAFPVFFEQKIMGVLSVGELCLKAKLDMIKTKRQEFFNKNPDCFDKYCQKNPEANPKFCIQDIISSHEKWVKDKKYVYNDKEYEEKIKKAVIEVKKLEKTLSKEMTRRRERYVVERTNNYNRAFYKGLHEKTLLGNEGLDNLWQLVEKILKDICNDFSFGHIFLFGVKQYTKEYPLKLDIVAKAEAMQSKLEDKKRKCSFDLTKIPEEARKEVKISTEMRELFKGLPFDLDKNTNFIRTSPVPFSPDSMIVTWAGYDNNLWNPHKTDRESRIALENAMRSFISIIASTFSGILVATTRDYMEKELKIFGHEAGQLTAGLDWMREIYLSDVEKLKNLEPEKLDDIQRDIEGYLKQLHFLYEKANYLIKLPEPDYVYFWAFRELLFKWKDIYRLEIDKKNLHLTLAYADPNDPYRPPIYGDQILLEQLVYNLVNNALKYCHRGTRIRMDCRKPNREPESPHILTVINYGLKMEEGDKPYQLYYRGKNVQQEEGLGIGLYIAKQIALAHDGKIEHKCDPVSEFNVPLIEPYIQANPRKHRSFILQLNKELDRLKQSGEHYKLMAEEKIGEPEYSKPSTIELIKSINNPTYKVTFTVIIPSKEGKR